MSRSVPDKEAISEVWKKVKDRSIPLKPLTQAEYDVLDETQKFADICYLVSKNAHITSPIPDNLNDCTWDQISYLSQNNLFKDYFSVGDTKTIVLNGQIGNGLTADNLEIELVVVGINHNPEREGDHLVHFLLGKVGSDHVGLIDDKYMKSFSSETNNFVINAPRTNIGGYQSCQLKKNIMCGDGTPLNPVSKTLMAALPEDLRKVMRSAKKWTDNVGDGSKTEASITQTTEYVCLIDEYETTGAKEYANPHVDKFQKQYQYFENIATPVIWKGYKGDLTINRTIYYRGPSPHSGADYWDGASQSGTADYLSGNWSRGIPALLFV